MGQFFRSWKRKVGTVTLLLACSVMGLCIRSAFIEDTVVVEDFGLCVASLQARIEWTWKVPFEAADQKEVRSRGIAWDSHNIRGIPAYDNDPDNRILDQELPYWNIAIPLTLLSAYLLLCKPRSIDRPPESV